MDTIQFQLSSTMRDYPSNNRRHWESAQQPTSCLPAFSSPEGNAEHRPEKFLWKLRFQTHWLFTSTSQANICWLCQRGILSPQRQTPDYPKTFWVMLMCLVSVWSPQIFCKLCFSSSFLVNFSVNRNFSGCLILILLRLTQHSCIPPFVAFLIYCSLPQINFCLLDATAPPAERGPGQYERVMNELSNSWRCISSQRTNQELPLKSSLWELLLLQLTCFWKQQEA